MAGLAGRIYGAVALRRRRWYETHPEARRRLIQPVISVGNLAVGGSGKTPLVAYLARLLLDLGERPSILSRGYGRPAAGPGVVIVTDGVRLRADFNRSGDEPLMLAQSLEGTAVLVSADRYEAGRMAEGPLGCTVHLLDDGFQHFRLERDVDLVMAAAADLEDTVLPFGRLREPLETARRADALVVVDGETQEPASLGSRLGVPQVFTARREEGVPRMIEPYGLPVPSLAGLRVVAVAGVARPHRFFDRVRQSGCTLVSALTYRDHHVFSDADVARMVRTVSESRADLIVTTEKDAVRLLPHRPIRAPLAWIPLTITIDPPADFRVWLRGRVHEARASRAGGA